MMDIFFDEFQVEVIGVDRTCLMRDFRFLNDLNGEDTFFTYVEEHSKADLICVMYEMIAPSYDIKVQSARANGKSIYHCIVEENKETKVFSSIQDISRFIMRILMN